MEDRQTALIKRTFCDLLLHYGQSCKGLAYPVLPGIHPVTAFPPSHPPLSEGSIYNYSFKGRLDMLI